MSSIVEAISDVASATVTDLGTVAVAAVACFAVVYGIRWTLRAFKAVR